MLSEKRDSIIQNLLSFGLSHDESVVYLHLYENGFQSALSVSRKLSIGRTKVYRILDILYEKGVVKHQLEDRGLRFGIKSPEDLSNIIRTKTHELSDLEAKLPDIMSDLESIVPSHIKKSEVLYYRGKKGLEQVTYNSTKANKVLRIYEMYDSMESFLDREVSEQMRQRLVDRQVTVMQLTNLKVIDAYTDVTELVQKFWEVRYIDPKRMKFKFEVLIYDDVYAMYSLENEDIFCVEIYNSKLATMQRELFDFVWANGTKMKITSPHGRAEL